MIARDPAATLRELRRVLEPGGRLATALWASLVENPWFSAPRESIVAVLGPERAAFARAFGKLGDPGEAAAAHRAAGLREVEARVLRELVGAADAPEHWERLARENGHFRRAAASMSDDQRAAVVDELDRRLSAYRAGGGLAVPRALVLVTARR
jgi:SAM-dependent methyltransferase